MNVDLSRHIGSSYCSGKMSNTAMVKDYIKECIVRERLKPGDKLPCEGQIAEDLGIGRNSVREATRALESIGLIEIKQGVGLILRSFNLDAIVDIFSYGFAMDKSMIFDLYEIRKMIECTIMPTVIEKINDITISKCELILAEWAFLVQQGTPVHDIDRKFHDTLYRPVGNELLIGLCGIFWAAFKQAEQSGVIVRYFPQDKAVALTVLEEHRAILEAIKQKDPEKATMLMEKHFRKIELGQQI